jgi:hypothetical protein
LILSKEATAPQLLMTVNTVNLQDHQPQTPLGLLLAPLISRRSPLESHYTILIGWTRPFNRLGIVQKSGQIRIGDRLVEINDVSVRNWNFEKIIRVLRCFDAGVRIRSLGFELLHDEIGIDNRTFVWSVARRRLYSFNSFIRGYKHDRRGNVDDDNGNNDNDGNDNDENDNDGNGNINNDGEECESIVRYEIHCELVVRHYQGYDETIKFSVWKRFSELKELHQVLTENFEWQMDGYEKSDLCRLSILVNGEPVDALSIIVHKSRAENRGRALCKKLKELIPKQMFAIAIQAAIGGKIVARETVSAMRKDVTAKCYGGDISRKRKLLDKQKKGKKKMRETKRNTMTAYVS